MQADTPSRAAFEPLAPNVREFSRYDLVVDARSPREYAEDHVPGAINLPVVGDAEYAEVGTRHRDDAHAAYLIGVEYALRNIAQQIKPLLSKFSPDASFLVYCFRGGKRSRLWADTLRTIGFQVDVLPGGWKNYRRWVRDGLELLPPQFDYRVLSGPTGCGKTRLLHALDAAGEQVIDLEDLACHRGSLIGGLPGKAQPTQKWFDSQLVERMRNMNPQRPVWIEAESKKIGQTQLPEALYQAMHRSTPLNLSAPMSERVALWREDYAHFASDPTAMVTMLEPLKPLIGKEELTLWHQLAAAGQTDTLFERVMTVHYDPCYARSTRRNYKDIERALTLEVPSLAPQHLGEVARQLARKP